MICKSHKLICYSQLNRKNISDVQTETFNLFLCKIFANFANFDFDDGNRSQKRWNNGGKRLEK